AIRRGGRWIRAACVEIRENDGMSWSAETVRVALHKQYAGFQVFSVRNEPSTDRLPALATILGRDRLMRRAVENGLAEAYPTFRSWRSLVLMVLVLALAFAKELMGLVVHDVVNHPGPDMATTLFCALIVSAIVIVTSQWIIANKPVLSRGKSEEKFRQT